MISKNNFHRISKNENITELLKVIKTEVEYAVEQVVAYSPIQN